MARSRLVAPLLTRSARWATTITWLRFLTSAGEGAASSACAWRLASSRLAASRERRAKVLARWWQKGMESPGSFDVGVGRRDGCPRAGCIVYANDSHLYIGAKWEPRSPLADPR